MLDIRVPLFQLVMCLSDVVDLVAPEVSNHHKSVAYAALCIADRLGLPPDRRRDLVLAALLHDIGALDTDEWLEAFRTDDEIDPAHALRGRSLLALFAPLRSASEIVALHHGPWGSDGPRTDPDTRVAAEALYVADRTASFLDRDALPLAQADAVRTRVLDLADGEISTETLRAYRDVSGSEAFWLTLAGALPGALFRRLRAAVSDELDLDLDGLLDLSRIFAQVIDFRSPFTATHSSGVAACAAELAGHAGLSCRERELMRVAGHLHDLGKLAVPSGILEKPGRLSAADLHAIRSHTYYTWTVLETVPSLRTIAEWAAFHHERLDGAGYPFGIGGKDLALGSRIMAVADVLAAVTEDRPYREGMTGNDALRVLRSMARSGALDADIVELVGRKLDALLRVRRAAQRSARDAYDRLVGTAPTECVAAAAPARTSARRAYA